MVPGQYSRDIYVLKKRQWKYSRKDHAKYPAPPPAPLDANHYSEGQFEFWTKEAMTESEKKRLKRLLTRLSK
jgi:hypothetical protein